MTGSINCWEVYYVFCKHTKPYPKNKYIVIVCFDSTPMGFLINSQINDFVQKRAHLMPCEVKLEHKDHQFLSHDSFVDCRDIFPFTHEELTDLRGEITPAVRPHILDAVSVCPVLPRNYKSLIASTNSNPQE